MLIEPNVTMDGKGFYISYNPVDVSIYGDVTTALVLGQEEHFYILNGDHRAGYKPLIPKGFYACLNYFKQHIAQIAKHSERV